MDDWLTSLPKEGIKSMCHWVLDFVTFAREPENRRVGIDARITVDGIFYEVEPDLAGEKVVLWWGLFDSELYVEHQSTRYGPYHPVGNPFPRSLSQALRKLTSKREPSKH